LSNSIQKARDVAAAWLSKLSRQLFSWLLALSSSHLWAKVPSKPQTKPMPPPTLSTSCELLSRGPDVNLMQQEVTLHTFLNDLLKTLRQDDYTPLAQFFHPKAKAGKNIGDKLHALLRNRYDKPWQFSIFRVWRITSPSGSKDLLDSCPESAGAKIITQFGFEKQFAIWIQIMGQNELGRLIFAIATDKGNIAITGMRLQQWTQGGHDWEYWREQAELQAKQNDKRSAYFTLDVAQKLLAGEDFVIYPEQRLMQEARNQLMSKAEVIHDINKSLKVESIAYVGSLLAKDGTGLLIREIVPPQASTHELLALCRKRAESLQQLAWLKPKQGLRCNYILAGMDPEQDSPLGGFYMTPDDLKNFQK
jgi:hypothetical protein